MGEDDTRFVPTSPDVTGARREVEHLRGELDVIVTELDRRRRELIDVRLQARRHPMAFTALVAVPVVAMVGLLGYVGWRVRKRHDLGWRLRRAIDRLGTALKRAIAHPERVAKKPGMGEKIVDRLGTSLANALIGKTVDEA